MVIGYVPDRIMWCIKSLHVCDCPYIDYNDLIVKPIKTPLDQLGFPQKFCCCCPLRVAAVFICLFSFFWGTFEMFTTEATIACVFPDRGDLFYYTKMVYMLLAMCFILACGGLLLGIITKRHEPLHVFVWYGFIYNCMTIIFIVGATTFCILNKKCAEKKRVFKTVFGIIWCCIFFYWLMIINSYKLILW